MEVYKKKKILATSLLLFALYVPMWGQDYEQRYGHAKKFFDKKNYSAAMAAFSPLTVYNPDNPYTRYASFYYAIAAYNEGLLKVAENRLLQLRERYPRWTKWGEVNYWLARIYFDQRQYFQAMRILEECRGKSMQKSITSLKTHYLDRIEDVETLAMLMQEYAGDSVVARLLVDAIAYGANPWQYAQLSDSLRTFLGLNRYADTRAPKWDVIFKNSYTVSLLFPFLVANLKPTLAPKINQKVLDLYRGIAMANDTLAKQGIYIDLQLFDTQRNAVATAECLEGEEIKKSDLLIGPLFPDQLALVQQFSTTHRINMINPVSGNEDFVNKNPYATLYLPSYSTIGMRSAEWLYANADNKKCMVFLGNQKKDVAMVNGFLKRADELGLIVEMLQSVSAQDADEIFDILATPTQFDEMGNPTEFKIKRNSIGTVFVASDNPLIYTKVISGVDTRGDSTIILGNQSWLYDEMANFETYERLRIAMAAPNFFLPTSPEYLKFKRSFIKRYGVLPNEYAKMGYEFMLFIGNCFDSYGANFPARLRELEFVRGYMSNGYSYKDASSNQLVPFIYFKNGELALSE